MPKVLLRRKFKWIEEEKSYLESRTGRKEERDDRIRKPLSAGEK